jgi:hypothetical protein
VRAPASLVSLLLLLALPACGGDTAEPSGDPSVLPGTGEDFVGARQDVTDVGCKRDGDTWRATGAVTNPAAEPSDYRIYVSFVDAEGATRELEQVDVRAVPPDVAVRWEGTADVGADGLQCVLRVERLVRR